jgi:hypothetical protein
MSDGPEKKQYGKPATHGRKKIYLYGGVCVGNRSVPSSTEENNKNPTQQDKQRRSGRMRYLQLIGTGNKFTAASRVKIKPVPPMAQTIHPEILLSLLNCINNE